MEKVAIVSAVRTPIGKLGGTISKIYPEELTRIVIDEALKRISLGDEHVDEVIIGQTKQSTDAPNIARVALLKAGWNEKIPGYTVHRQCASGMQAILNGLQQIQVGFSDIVVVGGVESMSTAPFYIRDARFGIGNGNKYLVDPNTESQPKSQPEERYGTFNMIETAENVAKKYHITREEQDEFAYKSQLNAIKAIDSGRFKEEIVEVTIPQRKKEAIIFNEDEYPRRNTNLEKLAKLKPIFEGGTVTAGNASGRNDGACGLVLMSEQKVRDLGVEPLGFIHSAAAIGLNPKYMGMGPLYATNKLLKKNNQRIMDYDLFEINEAFASQSVACAKGLNINTNLLNVNGGAIALGHPLGCSGARIITTLLYELIKREKKLGLASICVAGGLGMAMSIENARI